MTRGRPRATAVLWTVLALLLQAVIAAAPVRAHASLTGSDPAEGSLLATAPERLVLHFSEPASPLVLVLFRPDGTRLPLSHYEVKDRDIVITPPAGLTNGTHVLSWRVVSEDGHPVGGSVIFAVGTPSSPPRQDGGATDWTVVALLWAGKIALYVGLFLGCGGALARRWLTPDKAPVAAPLWAFVGLGILALPVLLLAQGLDALQLPLSGAKSLAVLAAGAGTTLGPALLVAAGAMILALVALSLAGPPGRLVSLTSLLLCGTALACTGHASSADPQMLARPAVAIHAMTVALWIGSLWPLRMELSGRSEQAIPALLRFSRVIPVVLVILMATGLVLAMMQLQQASALWTTDYGKLLSAKLALVAILLLAGIWNHWYLTAPALRGEAWASLWLARSIAVELFLAIFIFGVVAAWRFTPPPRAEMVAGQSNIHLHNQKVMAEVMVSPDKAGPVMIAITLTDMESKIFAAKELTMSLSLPSAGLEPIHRKAKQVIPGQWTVEAVILPLPGNWTIDLNVLVSDFESVRLHGEVVIK